MVIDAWALVGYILGEDGFEEIARYLRSDRVASIDMVVERVANAIIVAVERGGIGIDCAESVQSFSTSRNQRC